MQKASRIFAALGGTLCSAISPSLISLPLTFALSVPAVGQEVVRGVDEPAIAAAPVVPQQVRYAGKMATRAGDTVEAVFRIYATEQGGEPLWIETQHLTIAEDGAYSVLLGGASASGLPQTVFAGGAARWLGVSVERGQEQERVLLSSVPYAMKSADAESLAGHAASDFVTQEQLAQLAQPAAQSSQQGAAPSAITPLSGGTVTGSGTAGTIPLWTGTLTQGNSEITQVGSDIGINEATPAATLDVGGTAMFRGTATLPAEATATPSSGYRSQLLDFSDSAWSTTTKAPVDQTWRLYVTDSGNDSASPTSSFNFQFQNGAGAPTPTILSIEQTGVIDFAPAQTFPGTIASVSGASPVTATTSSGTVTVGLNTDALETTLNNSYARLGAADTFTAPITFASAQTFPGTINSVTGTGPVSAITNSGNVTVSLDTSALETTLDSVYPQLSADNEFAGYNYFDETVTAKYGVTGYSTGEYATDSGILGITGSDSSGSQVYQTRYVINAGVWGDNSGNTTLGTFTNAGVIGTADNNPAGLFYNDSKSYPSVTAINFGTKGTGLFTTLMAASPAGTCGIGGSGDLTCTGQVKTLATTNGGERKVETYAMQSPENWMEDFGSGMMQNGVAVVKIDPSFAETVSATAEYHVFLTPKGDSKGLYVINETPESFEVRESGGGTSSLSFDYRIVAKRRGYEAQRLIDVTERYKAESELAAPPKRGKVPHDPRVRPQARRNGQSAAVEPARAPLP